MQNIRRDALTELSTMPRRFPPPWSIDTEAYGDQASARS